MFKAHKLHRERVVTYNKGFAMMLQKHGRKINVTMMRNGKVAYIVMLG